MAPTRQKSHNPQRRHDQAVSQIHAPSEPIDWERYRPHIQNLYCDELWSLRKISEWLRVQYGVRATSKQYKDRLKIWKLGKNLHAADIAPLLEAFQEAERDPRRPRVRLRCRLVTRRHIEEYLKRTNNSEAQVLVKPQAKSAQPTPSDITLDYANTDDPSTPVHPEEHQPTPLTLTPRSLATTDSDPSFQSTRLPSPVSCNGTRLEQRSLMDFQTDSPAINLQECCDRLDVVCPPEPVPSHPPQSDTPAELLHLPEGSEAEKMWLAINSNKIFNHILNQWLGADSSADAESCQLKMFNIMFGSSASSYGSLHDLLHDLGPWSATAEHTNNDHGDMERPQAFLAHFFVGCILQRQGYPGDATKVFRFAGHILDDMIRSCHPECLVALDVMLAVLETQGQKDDAADFLSGVLVSCRQNLSTAPVAQTVNFLVAAATRQLDVAEWDIEHLESIHKRLEDDFGKESPSALAGLYHIAWRCAREESLQERALHMLEELLPLARSSRSHFLTITCMTTMAGVLSRIGRQEESIQRMTEAIVEIDRKYAPYHPYRLEALHRLANFLLGAQRFQEAQNILKAVVTERIRVLGDNNFLTQRSREQLRIATASIRENTRPQEDNPRSAITCMS